MNRTPFIFLIAAMFVNGFIFTSNITAQCPTGQVHATELEGKDVEDIESRLSDQTKKDLQKWDGYFEAVHAGKTTQHELFGWFDGLRHDYGLTRGGLGLHPDHLIGSETYMYEYSFLAPESHLRNSSSVSGNALGSGWEDTHSYYFEYKFSVNDSTKLVETKERQLFSVTNHEYHGACLKPVIYFYPTKEQDISVRLHYAGDITVSYPHYDARLNGWNIRAYPDGKIIDQLDQEEYSYIFWEGSPLNVHYDLSEGFIVEGEKSEAFLRETLKKMGLKPREYNEFIVYWFPKLKNNKYNLIHFAHEEYENSARLEITPKPDSLLRVFMVYKPLTEKIEIRPQNIAPFVRTGFTVVEWGGTELTKM